MKKFVLPFLSLALLVTSCKKDSDSDNGGSDKTFIQLQKWEGSLESFTFTYNAQDQLTGVTYKDKRAGSSESKTATITWKNGLPEKANINMTYGASTYMLQEMTFTLDGQNRIAQTLSKFFKPDNTPYPGASPRTATYGFTNNRIVSASNSDEAGDGHKFTYDANGNLETLPYTNSVVTKETVEAIYDKGINPLAENGLGMLLYVMFGDNELLTSQLLSAHNPTSVKWVFTSTLTVETVPQDVFVGTDLFEYKYTYSNDGILTEIDYKNTYESKKNGTVTNTDEESDKITITAVKKQRK